MSLTPCVEFSGYKQRGGYGVKKHGKKAVLAHRLAFVEKHGLALSDIDGQFVRHKCDNPACVNPDHLELGTHQDNMRDMVERNRQARGERKGRVKLTEQQVLWVRKVYAPFSQEFSTVKLARMLGVSPAHIWRIVRGKLWTHIEMTKEAA
uniref:Putative bacteriophage-related protein n=1 Tax=Ralstonia pickettii (strain 12D) TaxID=428406 RepID=C6BBU3_RALP1